MRRTAIFGPPGTGKTTTLLGIVQDKFAGGATPERVAFVSFTRKAADEARDRAVKQFGFDKKRFKYFRTIHSLALSTLHLGRADVMGDKDWAVLSNQLGKYLAITSRKELRSIFEQPIKTPGDVAIFYIGKARLEARDWEDYYQHIPERVKRGVLTEQQYMHVGHSLDQYKRAHSVIDFTDMLELALAESEPISIDYAIVDEAQDLSRVQWLLIEKLFSTARELYMAGDDDQAIYRWSGADVSEFQQRARQCDEIRVLDKSWRLPSSVFAVANRIIERVKGDRQAKAWSPRGEVGGVHAFTQLASVPLQREGTWYLLSRAKVHEIYYRRILRSAAIPYYLHHRPSIIHSEIRGLVAYGRLRAGMEIDAAGVQALYAILADSALEAGEFRDAAKDIDSAGSYTRVWLAKELGLRTALNTAFYVDHPDHPINLSFSTRYMYFRYLSRCQQLKLDYYAPIRHHISTMHAVKGGEADHVVLLADVTPMIAEDMYMGGLARDDEHRVFYVGATRAKHSLWIARYPQASRNANVYPTEGLLSGGER